MGIKHFKASDHSPEAQSAVKFGDTYSLTSIDRNVQADTGERRLLPTLFVVEKGQPVTYKALGPSSLYLIEGEYQLEDLSIPGKAILLGPGDVVITEEGTLVKCSTPSKARAFGVTYVSAPAVITDLLSE